MSRPFYPEKAVIFVGIMLADKSLFKKSVVELKKYFGEILFISRDFDFSHTDYYEKKMGTSLVKRFVFLGIL